MRKNEIIKINYIILGEVVFGLCSSFEAGIRHQIHQLLGSKPGKEGNMNWDEIEEKFIEWEKNLPDDICEIAVSDPRFLAQYAWHAAWHVAQQHVQPTLPMGDGLASPICGEVNYCIHRDD